MIIGCAGSGKTTLAFKLHKKLNLPLIHLDQHYWKPGWKRSDLYEFAQIHDNFCQTDKWIIEGSYRPRGHNLPYIPDISYPENIQSKDAKDQWVLQTLQKLSQGNV